MKKKSHSTSTALSALIQVRVEARGSTKVLGALMAIAALIARLVHFLWQHAR